MSDNETKTVRIVIEGDVIFYGDENAYRDAMILNLEGGGSIPSMKNRSVELSILPEAETLLSEPWKEGMRSAPIWEVEESLRYYEGRVEWYQKQIDRGHTDGGKRVDLLNWVTEGVNFIVALLVEKKSEGFRNLIEDVGVREFGDIPDGATFADKFGRIYVKTSGGSASASEVVDPDGNFHPVFDEVSGRKYHTYTEEDYEEDPIVFDTWPYFILSRKS